MGLEEIEYLALLGVSCQKDIELFPGSLVHSFKQTRERTLENKGSNIFKHLLLLFRQKILKSKRIEQGLIGGIHR